VKNGKNMGAGKAGFIRRAGKQEHERKREEMLTTDGQDEHGRGNDHEQETEEAEREEWQPRMKR